MERYSVCTELSNLRIEIKGFAGNSKMIMIIRTKIYTVLIRFKATLLKPEVVSFGGYSTILDYRPLTLHCFLRPGIEAMV